MATLRIHPEYQPLETVPFASEKSRRRKPIVSAVVAAYLTIAIVQPEQIAYLFVLLPFVLIALELAFEVADKLDGR